MHVLHERFLQLFTFLPTSLASHVILADWRMSLASLQVSPSLLPFIPIRMRPAQGLFIQPLALAGLYCPNLVPLLLVGWQSPLCKLTIASEYFAGMKPLATF